MDNKLVPIEREGQRVLLTAQLAEGYGTEERAITDNFNNNKKRYEEGKHYFLLTGDDLREFKRKNEIFGFAPNLNKLYLWTERGALLHAKSLNTDRAWEVYDRLVETYFRAVKVLKEKVPRKTEGQLAAETKRAAAMILNAKNRTAERFQKLWDRANVKPEYQAMALGSLFAEDGVDLPRIALQGTKVTYDKGQIAEKIGVYSKASGGKKPHAQAIGAIISELEIAPDEQESVPYSHNGHDGTDIQYAESVIDKVRTWLAAKNWPDTIFAGNKNYPVLYRGEGE